MTTMLLHERILAQPITPQDKCPLFARLPAELRTQIFSLALTDEPDLSSDAVFNRWTSHTRPLHFAHGKTHYELLRTCRAVYQECWIPAFLTEQTIWITSPNRAPPEYDVRAGYERLGRTLQCIAEQQGKNMQMDHLRIFTQMWMLKAGDFETLLATPHLRPRKLTLMIQDIESWRWESDEYDWLDGTYPKGVNGAISSCVEDFYIETETDTGRSGLPCMVGKNIVLQCQFQRRDGVILYADADAAKHSRRSEKRTLYTQSGFRDDTEPGTIYYHVVSVPFRRRAVIEKDLARVSMEDDFSTEGRPRRPHQEPIKLELPDGANPMEHMGPFVREEASSSDIRTRGIFLGFMKRSRRR